MYKPHLLLLLLSLVSFTPIIKSSCLYRLSQTFRDSHRVQLINKGLSIPLVISYVFYFGVRIVIYLIIYFILMFVILPISNNVCI